MVSSYQNSAVIKILVLGEHNCSSYAFDVASDIVSRLSSSGFQIQSKIRNNFDRHVVTVVKQVGGKVEKVSGLEDGVDMLLVVECELETPTVYLAQDALDKGIPVFAVAGDIFRYKSQGNHLLLKHGGIMVTSHQDILDFLPAFNLHAILKQ